MRIIRRICPILFGLCIWASAAWAQAPGTFTPTGSMTTARAGQRAILLRDGRVLMLVGQNLIGSSWTAEVYDPLTGTFTPTGKMISDVIPGVCLLTDGRVLLFGGTGNNLSPQLYDPSTGTFTATGATTTGGGIATLLKNGKVLIAGDPPQVYDPVSDSFAPTGPFIGPFYYGPFFMVETTTLLQDGRVLVTGSADNSDGYLEHEELYDPITGTFKVTGKPHTFGLGSDIWGAHTATLLADGKVLLAGGVSEDFGTFSTAELFDPSTDTFTLTANMTTPRAGHTATLLPDGTVLLAGGQLVGGIRSAELYNPATGTFSPTGNMTAGRFWQAATVLLDGRVLVSGGIGSGYDWLSSAELYNSNCSVNNCGTPGSDPWQRAINLMKASAGTDSCNFWQWAWFWQTVPAFSGAPVGFGITGSISNALMFQITTAGGGDPTANISAEQWMAYFRQVVQQ